MRGDEQRIVDAFAAWLEARRWRSSRGRLLRPPRHSRQRDPLYVEAKGRTKAIGLDVDTLYGQLLRRMPIAEDPTARFAVVVPSEGAKAARRVPERIRQLLRIDLYEVDAKDAVRGLD
jgi:hypothetical protein